MTENKPGLTDEELEQQDGEQLPDREQMSLINANLAAPINAAVAANVLSDNSVAYANAEQTAPITQTNQEHPCLTNSASKSSRRRRASSCPTASRCRFSTR